MTPAFSPEDIQRELAIHRNRISISASGEEDRRCSDRYFACGIVFYDANRIFGSSRYKRGIDLLI